MAVNFDEKLVVAISSRALLDLDEIHAVFERDGVDTYCAYQIEHENTTSQPGAAFTVIRQLLGLNGNNLENSKVEVILLLRNSADIFFDYHKTLCNYAMEHVATGHGLMG